MSDSLLLAVVLIYTTEEEREALSRPRVLQLTRDRDESAAEQLRISAEG